MKKLLFIIMSILIMVIMTSCNNDVVYECTPIYAFDTTVSMVFYNEGNYKTYYNEIKNKFNEINRIANDFETNTEKNNVYVLNQNRIVESELLADMLSKAKELKEDTSGFFNPFIGRLTHLWKDAIKEERVLDNSVIEEELEIMNNTELNIDGNKITLIGNGNIDLGAFAKGYALQWAKNYLKEKNVNKYYINCGSSSIYIADKELSVSLSKPYDNGSILEFKASNIGIATSSPKYQFVEIDGIKYHHLINPFTGLPSNIYDSVNVIGDDNLKNDIYSTAIFSMDLESAKAFANDKNINIVLFKNDEIIYQKEKL